MVPPHRDETGAQVRRRRRTAARCSPLDHSGQRDPELDLFEPDRREPSDYGLSESELWSEIRRCRAAGWLDWELQQRFRNPADLRRELDAARDSDRICHPHLEGSYV